MLDSLKDPETGKFKPAVIIGAGGVAVAGVFLIFSKSSGSSQAGVPGVVSGGQSGDNTAALSDLQDAITQLGNQIEGHSNVPDAVPTVPPVTPPATTPPGATPPPATIPPWRVWPPWLPRPTPTITPTPTPSPIVRPPIPSPTSFNLVTNGLQRIYTMVGGRLVPSSQRSFNFSSTVGTVVNRQYAPIGTGGPSSTTVKTGQFQQITSGQWAGSYIKVGDPGATVT